MARYIDAEKIEQFLRTQMDMQDLYLPIHFVEAIEDMPTADVQEVKHGHWKASGHWCVSCTNCCLMLSDYEGFYASEEAKYCPRCGARMDGD